MWSKACGQRHVVKGMWSKACGQRLVVKGMWSKAKYQKIGKSGTSDFDNFGFWKCCSWISRLCGIGRRLRRLQRPGVVSFKAFTRNSKSQQKPTFPKIGKFDCRKIPKHVFLKTLRMEHAIAENDRTARETPVKNCRASERDFCDEISATRFLDPLTPLPRNPPRAPISYAGIYVGVRGLPARLILSLGAMG